LRELSTGSGFPLKTDVGIKAAAAVSIHAILQDRESEKLAPQERFFLEF
jgi:hypothetical protein